MSELDEMREKMRQVLRERAAYPLAHPLEETLDQLLSLSTDTVRLAVVRKEGEFIHKRAFYDDWAGKIGLEGYKLAIEDVFSAGYVQEVQDG